MPDSDTFELVKELVQKSNKITALTGAGISVDSGIPDFRSEGGLWERYDPHEYATIESFMKNGTSLILDHFSPKTPKKAYFITFIKDAKVRILANIAQKAYP